MKKHVTRNMTGRFGAGLLIGAIMSMGGCSAVKKAISSGTGSDTSSGGGSGGSSATTSLINIVGQVFGTSSGGAHQKRKNPGNARRVGRDQEGLASCAVSVYDLTGSTVLATGTTDEDGKFVINSGNMTAGSSYKVVSVCGSKSFTAIIGADVTPPAEKTPAVVDAKATLIAVEIVRAIVTAVTSAVASISGLPVSAQQAIIASLLSPDNVTRIVAAIATTIQTAIDNGTMQVPSDTASTAMASSVAAVDTSDTTAASAALDSAEASYTSDATDSGSANTIPASVSSAVTGAAQAASAFPSCDSTLEGSSAPACTKAVAKMMYNVLHFSVGLKMGSTGAAFASLADCSSSNSALTSAFPGAEFLTHSDDVRIPSDMCFVSAKLQGVDRNQSYSSNDHGGGGDKGPVFTENGTSVSTGVLTAMGTALFNDYTYHLSDVDSLVFGYSSGNGGFNARPIAVRRTLNFLTAPGMGNYDPEERANFILNGVSVTNVSAYLSGVTLECPDCFEHAFGFTTPAWSSATGATALAAAFGSSTWNGSIFEKLYGGTIPNAAKIQEEISNEKIHSEYNRTGQPTFQVLYKNEPRWENPYCQYGRDSYPDEWVDQMLGITTTICTDQEGDAVLPVTADAILGAPDSSTHLSNVTQINTRASGKGQFYLYPQWNGGSYSGVFQLINAQNGRMMTDELFNPRYVQVIMKDSQCDTTHFPAFASSGPGCRVGKMYNASVSWTCGGSGPCSMTSTMVPGSSSINTATAPTGSSHFVLTVKHNPKTIWSPCDMEGPCQPSHVGVSNSGDFSSYQDLKVTISSDGAVTAAALGTPSGASEYAVIPNWSCSEGSPCEQAGYYLIGSTGNIFTNASPASGLTTFTSDRAPWSCSGMGSCSPAINAVKYDDIYFEAAMGGSAFPDGNSSTGSWSAVALQTQIYNGPATNPIYDCTQDPFYLDANNNDQLDVVENDDGTHTCSEKTFNQSWEVVNYIHGNQWDSPENRESHTGDAGRIKPLANTFRYGDPGPVNALLNTAFGAWLDGNHTLTSTTNLNALQTFALTFLFLDGDGLRNIDGLLPTPSGQQPLQFKIISPLFSGGSGDQLSTINTAIGLSILNNHQ